MVLTVVGLGPGDPELITLKGMRAIEAADLVFAPASRDRGDSLALRMAEPWIDASRQQVIELTLAMTRDTAESGPFYAAAAEQIAAAFAACAETTRQDAIRGVYLLLGDPLLYGTFAAIGRALRTSAPDIAVEIAPGVTSFAAVAARTQMTLGSGDGRVAIVPASTTMNAADLQRLLADFETLVLMKAGRALPHILDALDELNILDAALFAERVGMPEEEIVWDVRTLRGQRRSYLSLVIVQRGR